MIDGFRNMHIFHAEVEQLSRFIFMNCHQHRIMKGMHEMKKSHQALKRYLNLDLIGSLENFKSSIDDAGSEVSMPYRQSIDYILIRLQGLAKLLIRVVQCTKTSSIYFLGLIKAGSFYMKGIIFIGTLASVWNRSRELCNFVVDQYNKLKTFRDKFMEKPGVKWVDGCYELPETLETWLGHEYTNLIVNQTYDLKMLLNEKDINSFIEGKNYMNKEFEKIQIDDKVTKKEESLDKIETNISNLSVDCEIEDFTPIPRIESKTVKNDKEIEHSLQLLSSKDSIMTFIKKETHYRRVDPKKSLSITNMKKKEWKEFSENIKNKSLLMQEGAFVNFVKDYLEDYKMQ